MSLRIQNNVEAFNAHRNLQGTEGNLARSMERLSSGFRINRAADDAAGLAISERLRGQVNGLGQAQRNTQDAVSLVQTAEGSLQEVHSMLQRTRELAVQYQNGTLSDDDKASIQDEVDQLKDEIQRIAQNSKFNDIDLLGSSGTVTFQIGAQDGDTIDLTTNDVWAKVNGANTFTLGDGSDIADIDAAIQAVSDERASFGAVQNRLEHTLNNLTTYHENLM